MANRKQDKYVLIVAANPGIDEVEAVLQAGYSRKRARVTASELRRNANVQARIAAIRNKQLASAPTLESYHSSLNLAAEAAQRNSNTAWILLRVAEMQRAELFGQQPEQAEQPRAVLVKFVESELPPETVAVANASAAAFEAMVGAPPGLMGRFRVESEAPAEPVERKPVPASAKPQEKPDRWLRCEQHGKFWNVASCPTCDALKWQD